MALITSRNCWALAGIGASTAMGLWGVIHLDVGGNLTANGTPVAATIFKVALVILILLSGLIGVMSFVVITMRNKLVRKARRERALRLDAKTDRLTGLGNRNKFRNAIAQRATTARKTGTGFSLIKLDLDHFKHINDLRGLEGGDNLLRQVAQRLQSLCSWDDTILRVGGDEFAVLTAMGHEQTIELANAIRKTLRAPFYVDGWSTTLRASVGIAMWFPDGIDGQFVEKADQAMFRAKQDGRDRIVLYKPAVGTLIRRSASLQNDLIEAVQDGLITPHFQPILDLRTSKITGFEALARWEHPEHGYISPGRFIPMVEKLGLIDELTDHLLHVACATACNWPADVRLSFNLSPMQFGAYSQERMGCLPDRIQSILTQTGVAPDRLDIEITESAIIPDLPLAKHIIQRLKEMNIRLSIDDFGTGTSSLTTLSQLPFDTLKIDRSFVRDIITEPENAAIVRAVMSLARSFGMSLTAEGIETPAEFTFFRASRCDRGQGFYFSKAVPEHEASAMLIQRNQVAG